MDQHEPAEVPTLAYQTVPVARRFVPPRPWGFWATLGWSLVVALVFLGAHIPVLIFMMATAGSDQPTEGYLQQLDTDGTFLCAGIIAAAVLCTATILLIILPTRVPVRDYLALRAPRPGSWIVWMLVMTAVLAVQELLMPYVGSEKDVAFMSNIYESAASPVLVYLGIVIAAPLIEELFFRGFVYKGIACSPIGPNGAILIPAVLWAVIHLQYSAGVIGIIFGLGLILGMARWWTGSLLIPIAMHVYQNLLATLEVAYDFTLLGWLMTQEP